MSSSAVQWSIMSHVFTGRPQRWVVKGHEHTHTHARARANSCNRTYRCKDTSKHFASGPREILRPRRIQASAPWASGYERVAYQYPRQPRALFCELAEGFIELDCINVGGDRQFQERIFNKFRVCCLENIDIFLWKHRGTVFLLCLFDVLITCF